MSGVLIVSSEGGALLDVSFRSAAVRSAVAAVASDRDAGALNAAARHGVPAHRLDAPDRETFFRNLGDLAESLGATHIFSASYAKLFDDAFLDRFPQRIYNTHHSLLPAYVGRNALARAQAYGNTLIGNTIHLIDRTVDEGAPLSQSVLAVPYDEDPRRTRHRLFESECRDLMQALLWLAAGRVRVVGGRPIVEGARFDDPAHAPALEHADCLGLRLPYPGDAMLAPVLDNLARARHAMAERRNRGRSASGAP